MWYGHVDDGATWFFLSSMPKVNYEKFSCSRHTRHVIKCYLSKDLSLDDLLKTLREITKLAPSQTLTNRAVIYQNKNKKSFNQRLIYFLWDQFYE